MGSRNSREDSGARKVVDKGEGGMTSSGILGPVGPCGLCLDFALSRWEAIEGFEIKGD